MGQSIWRAASLLTEVVPQLAAASCKNNQQQCFHKASTVGFAAAERCICCLHTDTLSAAASMSSCEMVRVLQAACETQQDAADESLYQLPAFKQLGRADVAKLLLVAAECGDSEGMYKLHWLESAKRLSSAAVLPALTAAVKRHDR
jgi:hypothetical protein